jgi:hypothetical protein
MASVVIIMIINVYNDVHIVIVKLKNTLQNTDF